MARSLSPLRPLPQLHREPREPSSPLSLQQLALMAVPNPEEAARHFLKPWHILRQKLENREYEEMREKFSKKHAKKIQVCDGGVKMGRPFELDLEFVS